MLIVICSHRMRKDVIEPACAKYASENAEELLIGKQYIVYGQCLVGGCLLYLIDPTIKGVVRPFWYPASLFAIHDDRLLCDWFFAQYPQCDFSGAVTAVWGYVELVTSAEHFTGLIERDPKALAVFRQHKIKCDELWRE